MKKQLNQTKEKQLKQKDLDDLIKKSIINKEHKNYGGLIDESRKLSTSINKISKYVQRLSNTYLVLLASHLVALLAIAYLYYHTFLS